MVHKPSGKPTGRPRGSKEGNQAKLNRIRRNLTQRETAWRNDPDVLIDATRLTPDQDRYNAIEDAAECWNIGMD